MRIKLPGPGEVIWTKHFAWFPKNIRNTVVWLESYYKCCIYDTDWEGEIYCYKKFFLEDSKEVQNYLLSKTALATAMEEK